MTAAFLTYLWERPEISNITNTPTSTSDMMLPYAHRIWLTVLPSVLGMHSWFNAYQFKIITKKIQLLPCSTSPLTILTETNTIRLSSPAIPVLSSSPVAQTCDHSPAILNSQAYGDHSQEAPSLLSIDRITTSPEDAGRTNPSGTSILPNTDQSQTSEQRPDFAHHDDVSGIGFKTESELKQISRTCGSVPTFHYWYTNGTLPGTTTLIYHQSSMSYIRWSVWRY